MGTKLKNDLQERLCFDKKRSLFYREIRVNETVKNHNYKFVIYKEYDNDTQVGRNFDIHYMAGFLWYAPCKNYTSNFDCYYQRQKTKHKNGIASFESYLKCNICGKNTQTHQEIEDLFLSTDSKDFVYTLRKLLKHEPKASIQRIFNVYKVWKEHKECELLVDLGYVNCIFNKAVFSQKKKAKIHFVNFLKTKEPDKEQYYKYLKLCEKYDLHSAYFLNECKCNYELYKYLIKQNENYSFYKDYKKLVLNCGHDFYDDYWRYPKNLREKHNILNEQYQNILEVRRLEYERQLEEKRKREQANADMLPMIVSKQLTANINGYTLYLANNIQDIENQARELHQCLITCGYHKKVANQECLLVFVKKESTPIATCEIDYNKNIRQFYGNEIDRDNCLPSQEIKDIMNLYLDGITKYSLAHLSATK